MDDELQEEDSGKRNHVGDLKFLKNLNLSKSSK